MGLWNRFSMRSKLVGLTIGSVVLCSVSLIYSLGRISETSLTSQIVSNLTALVSTKAAEIESSIHSLQAQVVNLSNSKFVQDALVSYESVAYGTGLDLDSDSDISSSSYFKSIESKYKETLDDSLKTIPLDSYALVLNGGFVVSEIGQSLLLGKNLKKGALKESNLANCFDSALKNGSHMTTLTTLNNYSGFFLCQKIVSKYDRDGYQKDATMGVLIANMKWSLISSLSKFEKGLGQTGQIFISDQNMLISPPRSLKEVNSLNELLQKELKFNHEHSGSSFGEAAGFDGDAVIFISQSVHPSDQNRWTITGQISKSEAFKSIYDLMKWSVAILCIGLILSSAIGYFIVSSIASQFKTASENVMSSSGQVQSAVSQIYEISNKVSTSTQQQASAMDETASAMEEISSMVDKTLDLSKSTASNSLVCSQKATDGSTRMEQLVDAVTSLGETTNHSLQEIKSTTGETLKEVLTAINTIESKTKIINEIAFQTKLLSFNASVEAARAGEHGKGFSVVAQEVGQLASSVDKSAKEIEEFLTSTSQKINQAINRTQNQIDQSISVSFSKVEYSKESALKGLEFFKELNELIHTIQSESSNVSTAADEQAKGISEINKAISEITQSNSTNASQVANLQNLSDALNESSNKLSKASDSMYVILNGDSPAESPVQTLNHPSHDDSESNLKAA